MVMTTQEQIRNAFWENNPDLVCKKTVRGRILPQNEQPVETRVAFVDFVESLHRDRQISDSLATRVTL